MKQREGGWRRRDNVVVESKIDETIGNLERN